MSDLEVEATLAVVGPDAAVVVDRIRHLTHLIGCALEPRPPQRLRDVYVDRGDGELRGAGAALRVRFPDAGRPVLGLKAEMRRLEGGGVERRERERTWGPDAWRMLEAELERFGLSPPAIDLDAGDEPLEALGRSGFDVVQDRETLRRPARLVRDGERVAEIALDEVRYRFAGRELVHREVEVEAVGEGPPARDAVARAARELADRFAPALRRWDHSKLATGRALERLLEEDGPPGGEPGAETYDRLEALLRAGETGARRP